MSRCSFIRSVTVALGVTRAAARRREGGILLRRALPPGDIVTPFPELAASVLDRHPLQALY